MKQKRSFLIFIVCFVLMLSACTGLRAYQNSLTMFNNTLETYLNHRDAMPPCEAKDELRAQVEPQFENANKALDNWGLHIAAGNDPEAQKAAYTQAWFYLIEVLVRHNIVEKEG